MSKARRYLLIFWGLKALGMLINLGSVRMLTRLFSLNEYAEYSLLLALALIFSSVVELGSTAALVRYYPLMEERVARSAVTLVVVWGLVLSGVGSFLVFVFLPSSFYLAVTVLGVLVSNAILTTTTTVELARHRVGWYSFMVFLQRVLYLLGLYLLDASDMFTVQYVLITLSAVNIFISLRYILTYCRPSLVFSEHHVLKEVYAYCWPIGISAGLTFAFGMGDRYVVDFYLDRELVAVYSFGFFVVNAAFQFLISALNGVGEPCFWTLYERFGSKEAFEFRRSLENSYAIVGILALVGLIYSRDQLIRLLAKREYEMAGELFVYFAVAFLLYGLFIMARYKVQIANKNIVVFVSYLVGGGAKIAVDIVLAPVLGLRGVMIGFVTGYVCLYTVLLVWYVFNGGVRWLWNRDLVTIVLVGVTLVGLPLFLPTGTALIASIPILWLAFRMKLLSHFKDVVHAYENAQ